ncbi:MAG TPA: TrkA family potassium uptake protein [Fastidiosipila sp.]|jgi:trk system potassium uptake protein TrkA|nr:TrkA family potassium uptake protein [Fastidiosipila sp.]
MKRVVIMGGGKLAYYLIESLQDVDVDITLIEQIEARGEHIVNRFDSVRVLTGDGTTISTLEAANLRDADFYVAATGRDEDNLVGCQIAKKYFNVKTTVARVMNPKNIKMFKELEVDLVYNSTQMLTDLIEHNIQYEGMQVVFNLRDTPNYIVEVHVSDDSKAIGMQLKDIDYPGTTRVVIITRKDKTSLIPTGYTTIERGDVLLVVTEEKYYDEIYNFLAR